MRVEKTGEARIDQSKKQDLYPVSGIMVVNVLEYRRVKGNMRPILGEISRPGPLSKPFRLSWLVS